jgi:REP element-mobilizing transposase RayT
MPEHIHLLIGEPAKGTPSTGIQMLKQRFSRRLRRKKRNVAGQFRLAFAGVDDSLRGFWQRRFYDFRVRALLGARRNTVWSLKKRVEKLHYMHLNPVKRKLVEHPRDWPWSSFSSTWTSSAE